MQGLSICRSKYSLGTRYWPIMKVSSSYEVVSAAADSSLAHSLLIGSDGCDLRASSFSG